MKRQPRSGCSGRQTFSQQLTLHLSLSKNTFRCAPSPGCLRLPVWTDQDGQSCTRHIATSSRYLSISRRTKGVQLSIVEAILEALPWGWISPELRYFDYRSGGPNLRSTILWVALLRLGPRKSLRTISTKSLPTHRKGRLNATEKPDAGSRHQLALLCHAHPLL
jgi:hypothetical protein